MTNYTVDTLHLGAFTTESGETIENLKLRYEHVGYSGQPLVVVCHALTGNHLTYGTDEHMIISFLLLMLLEVLLVQVPP